MKTVLSPIIVWFRRDFRLEDHPALHHAVASGRPIVPLFIWAPDEEAPWQPGAASRAWLHHSLAALDAALRKRGSKLILRTGDSLRVLRDVAQETGADTVYWSRLYEPATQARDTRVKAALREDGFTVRSFNSALLFEPWNVENKSGAPFQVFTPFWKHCLTLSEPGEPYPAPRAITGLHEWPSSCPLDQLALRPTISWDQGFYDVWTPGEAGAHKQLALFVDQHMARYDEQRNFPAESGTSRMSPHLHFGEIGPRQIWHEAQRAAASDSRKGAIKGTETFLREIGWREFAHHLLFHFPHTPEEPLRPEFKQFPWRNDPQGLRAWQRGQTGYPIVDAGMRELWATGWMHNRVRMIVGSFLVKDLLIPWQEGARWFWDTLVDANLANNTLGWQWTAGCGADAAPYFRIFNPHLQGAKFDPDNTYIHAWVPEADHATYAAPIVDHHEARDRALEALSAIKK